MMKKRRRGKGMRVTASLLRSQFNWTRNRMDFLTPLTGADTRWLEMVEISVREGRQNKRTETDVVQSFVVQQHALVDVLDDLMEAQDGVAPLHHHVGDLPSSPPSREPQKSPPIESSIKTPGRASRSGPGKLTPCRLEMIFHNFASI